MEGANSKPTLNVDTGTWEGWVNSIVLWAGRDPMEFLITILLILSPLFTISLMLAWRLASILDAKAKDTTRKTKKGANLSKIRKNK